MEGKPPTIRQWMRAEGHNYPDRKSCVLACMEALGCKKQSAESRYTQVISVQKNADEAGHPPPQKSNGRSVFNLIKKIDLLSRVEDSLLRLGDRMLTDEEFRLEFLPDTSKTKFMKVIKSQGGFPKNRVQSENKWYWGRDENIAMVKQHLDAY